MKLRECHQQELLQSAIAPEVITLNFKSLDDAYGEIIYSPNVPRRNDGRLTQGMLATYRHLEDGGWHCSGLDALTLEDSLWGCFKPNRPRLTKEGKPIKYEHPPKAPTEAFCLKIGRHQWRKIAKKAGVECPNLEEIPNEEIAVAFWQWVKETPEVTIVLTEGAKKTASLLSHGYAALGLPGIYSGYRSKDADGVELIHKQLIPQLEAFCQEGREFTVCFDNDTKPTTKKAVRTAIANMGHLIQERKCQVTVMTWTGTAKGIDDVIAGNGEAILDQIFVSRLSLEYYKLSEYTDLSALVQQTVDCRYLGNSLAIPDDARLVGIKSAKGTGKTETLTQLVKKALDTGKPVIVLSHREQLSKELANRFTHPYRSQLEFKADGFNGYVLCVDSLHPKANPAFDPARYPDALVILDEAEQVIWHLLNSATCHKNRASILKTLTELVNGASQIILSDADLTKISIDYIKGLLELPVVPWVGVNKFIPTNSRKLFLYDTPESLFSDIVECLKNGERLMIHTGAQKVKSQWGSINLERMLVKAFPHLKILRIDAESVAEPGHPAFCVMGSINTVIPNYDVVIASPTLETGVSIDIQGHFHRVFGFAQGSQTAQAVCQSLARVREDIPRHIWMKNYSSQRIGNGSINPYQLVTSEDKLFKANSLLLGNLDTIANLDGHSPRHCSTWATYAAIHNYGFKHYRQLIISLLEAEGYCITSTDAPEDGQEIKEFVKACAEAAYQEHCEKVADAPIVDDAEFDRLANARAKSEPERLSEQKTAISKKYMMDDPEITPEVVAHDDNGLYKQLQLRYYLTIGNQFLPQRDVKQVKKLTKETGDAFTPDINRACYSAQIYVLQALNIQQFLTGESFTSDGLRDWFAYVCQFRRQIKDILNYSINPEKDSPIAFAQNLLRTIGLKMSCDRRRVSGKITRIYALVASPLNDLGEMIMGRWFERDSNRVVCDTPPLKELYVA